MPTYNFINTETGEEIQIFMWIREYEQYKKDNPHLKQFLTGAPAIGYNDAKKPDEGFRDILRDIKKGSGAGADVNTFD